MTPEAKTLNPHVGQPAVAVPGIGGLSAPKHDIDVQTRIPGKQLVRDLTKHKIGSAKTYRYWIGVTPNCPVSYITCAGLAFSKTNEKLITDPSGGNKTMRVPVIGTIVFIDEERVRKLRAEIPRLVVRFNDGQEHEPGTGLNIGDAHIQPKAGSIIDIPADDENAERMNIGMPAVPYHYRPGDVPAARFMFAQLCADQENGSRGERYPETLETAGFEWPESLNIDELLS